MFKGYRWLTAGIAGAMLAAPGISHAQGVFGGEPVAQPGVATPASGLPQAQGSFKPPAPIRPGQPISVLVFPFGLLGGEEMAPAADPAAPGVAPPDGGAGPATSGLTQAQEHVTAYVTAAVKAGLLASPYFSVATYHPTSALVQRAQKDDVVKPEHLQGLIVPATGGVDAEKARTLTYRLGMQALLTGTVDLKSDAKANSAEVTVEAQLVNSATGEVIRSAAVSGAAAGAQGVPLAVVEERAALDASHKVLPALGIELVTLQGGSDNPKVEKPKRGKKAAKPATDKQAEREAKKAAEAAKKAEAAARREAKAAAEKAEREARAAAKAEKKARKAEEKSEAAPAKVQQDNPAAQEAPAAPATPAGAAAAEEPAAVGNTVPATANEAGQPVPYGYALGEQQSALPQRDRKGLRIPPWLGVAGFLYGLSFLVF